MDPFLCVKETYGDDDVSSHSSSKNETEVGMANFAFKAETNSLFVEAALTTTLFKECALRRRCSCCRCFREDDVLKEEVKESDDDDWVLVILKTVGLVFHYFFIFHHIRVLKSMFSSIDRFFEKTSHRARIHIGEIFVSRAKFERTHPRSSFRVCFRKCPRL